MNIAIDKCFVFRTRFYFTLDVVQQIHRDNHIESFIDFIRHIVAIYNYEPCNLGFIHYFFKGNIQSI